MLLSTVLSSICIAGLVHALPSTSNSYKKTTMNVTFDDLPPNPITGQLDGSPVTPPYHSLAFPGINYAQPALTLKAQSSPNVGISDVTMRTMAGVTNATITSVYPNSKTAYFDLHQFYFGCNLDDQTVIATATACTVQVVGFQGSKAVATQLFTFLPSGLLASPLTQANLGTGFLALTNATFAVLVSNTTPMLTFLNLDNFIVDVWLTS